MSYGCISCYSVGGGYRGIQSDTERENRRGDMEGFKIKLNNISIHCHCVRVSVCAEGVSPSRIIFRVTLYRVLSFMGNCIFCHSRSS